jgi:adenine-specific DNA-methyltransferase
MEKLKMESIDLTQKNIEKIGKLFPNVITEMRDENGHLKKGINFDLLKQELSGDVVDGEECYDFTWVGKKAAIVEGNTPIRKTLRPCIEESKDWESTGNLYIEGDNLDVLKLLQESYLNSIKMIYIDPPYNTGNDFIYKDNFSMDKDEYEEELGLYDEDDNRLFKNTETNGRFHSDWCSMIFSRIKLARNILSDNGVIFISIDDNELHNLRKICDEIFGEKNFVADIAVVNNLKGRNDKRYIARANERLLMYVKTQNFEEQGLKLPEARMSEFNNEDENGKFRLLGLRKRGGADTRLQRPNMFYPIFVNPEDGSVSVTKEDKHSIEVYPYKSDGTEGCWRWGYSTTKNRYNELIAKKVGQDERYDIFEKDYLETNGQLRRIKPKSVMSGTEYSTDGATKQYRDLMGKIDFSNPKPVGFIKDLIDYSTESNNEEIVLDFFSGSATTAHAVMQLNAEDGGNRKFIMVQLPEPTDEKSEAFKAGYKNISEIGKERIRRAGEKIKADNKDKEGIDYLDIGFRVLKVDTTNMKDVYYAANEYTQSMLAGLESNIKEDRTDLDLLYGVLLDWGLPLSLKHKIEEIEGVSVHTVDEGSLVACFAEKISEKVVREIAKRQPLRVVFRDSSFANSPDKINVEEIFKLLAPNTTVKVI